MTNDDSDIAAQNIVQNGPRDYAGLPSSRTSVPRAMTVPFAGKSDAAHGDPCCNCLIRMALENLTWTWDVMGKICRSAPDGSAMAGRIVPPGSISPPRLQIIGPTIRQAIRCRDAQSRPYWAIFLRSVLRSIPRIWAARVLLPPAFARTLRM